MGTSFYPVGSIVMVFGTFCSSNLCFFTHASQDNPASEVVPCSRGGVFFPIASASSEVFLKLRATGIESVPFSLL